MLRRVIASAVATSAALSTVFLLPTTPASAASATPVQISERIIVGGAVKESSPKVGVINGRTAVVFGAHDGRVYALDANDTGANDGRTGLGNVPGWPFNTGVGINSTPAIGDVDGNGSNEVFIGSGHSGVRAGDMWALNADGGVRWKYSPGDQVDPDNAVHSSPALGDVNSDNTADVSGFTLGLHGWSFNAANGGINPGWHIYQDDSVFSSPALADIDGDGQSDYVVGGDSTEGGVVDHRGGVVRALRGDGSVIWQFFTGDIVRSSPVVANVTGDAAPEIIVGTGDFWDQNGSPNADSRRVWVLNKNGQLLWSRDLGGYTMAAPAVADVNGDGRLDIIEATWDARNGGNNQGAIWALDGENNPLPGYPRATRSAGTRDSVLGQIVTADLENDGNQDILVAHGAGLFAYNGENGAEEFWHVNQGANDQASTPGGGYENSPWVGDLDADGRLDIVLAGQQFDQPNGIVSRYEMPNTVARLGVNGYHEFRKDPRNTASFTNPPLTQNRCTPEVANKGYLLHASDGGVFAFCRNFYGSMGDKPLNQPVVGAASTPDRGGYWQVARDGGIFSFGNAQFFGSAGDIRLNQPIVGMAPLPNGRGYWLVASDGGVFSYGDAWFHGSTGNIALNQPIVGMASTPDGGGYWLVARDGGVFAFGNARFLGSTGNIRLNQPIVGMAAATAPGVGYWLVAADGGIFTFGDAKFYGSTGALKLNAPIVGMQTNGSNYRLIASDGGVFSFGGAEFLGSAGNIRLNQPIVAGN